MGIKLLEMGIKFSLEMGIKLLEMDIKFSLEMGIKFSLEMDI